VDVGEHERPGGDEHERGDRHGATAEMVGQAAEDQQRGDDRDEVRDGRGREVGVAELIGPPIQVIERDRARGGGEDRPLEP
jgi:hypothetical protein